MNNTTDNLDQNIHLTTNNTNNFISGNANQIVEKAYSPYKEEGLSYQTLKEFFENDENFTEKELKKSSLTESDTIPTILLDAKAFAHVLSDSIIKEIKDLEGSNFQRTASTLSDLLIGLSTTSTNEDEVKQYKELAAIIAKIGTEESCLQPAKEGLYHNEALFIAKKIFGLKSGESYTMPGGWNGFPGHAMLYEFIRNEGGSYDIVIYNTGDGAEHHFTKIDENKLKICPIKRYNGVTCEELFFATKKGLETEPESIKPAFFQKLLECKFFINHDKYAKVTAHDIYIAFSIFESKEVAVDDSFIKFMTKQRAGTCAYRVLEPFLFNHLTKDLKEYTNKIKVYEKTIYNLELIALIGFYRQIDKAINENSSNDLSADLFLLEQATEKFLRSEAKLFQVGLENVENSQSLLTYDEAKKAYCTCKVILKKIAAWNEGISKNLKGEKLDLSESSKFDETNEIEVRKEAILNLQKNALLNPLIENNSIEIESSLLETFPSPKADELAPLLTKIVTEIEEAISNPNEQTKIRMQIEYLVDQLEIPSPHFIRKHENDTFTCSKNNHKIVYTKYEDGKNYDIEEAQYALYVDENKNECCADFCADYWQRIPEKDLKECLQSFDKILNYYFLATFLPIVNLPEQQNCYYALYAFINMLAIRIDENKEMGPKLGDYGLRFLLTENDYEAFSTFYDRKTKGRFEEICNYFSKRQSQCIIRREWVKSTSRGNSPEQMFNLVRNNITKDDHCLTETPEFHYFDQLLQKDDSVKKYYETATLNSQIDQKKFTHPKMAIIADMALITDPTFDNVFTKCNLQHLLHLKNMAALIEIIMRSDDYYKNPPSLNKNALLKSKGKSSYNGFEIKYTYFNLELGKWPKLDYNIQPSKNMFGEIEDSFTGLICPQSIRYIRSLENYKEEGAILTCYTEYHSNPVIDKLIRRSNCIPELLPFTLLQDFARNYNLFDQRISQQAFEVFFFKHFKENKHPFFDQINNYDVHEWIESVNMSGQILKKRTPKDITALQKQCEKFISKGVQIFYDFQPGQQPSVHAALFFLRFSIYLKKAVQHSKFGLNFDERKILQEWLKRDTFDNTELAAIHHHLLASYSLEDVKKLSDEQIGEISASWLYFQSIEEDKNWLHPSLKNSVVSWFYKEFSLVVVEKFRKDPELRNRCLNKALSGLGIKIDKEWESGDGKSSNESEKKEILNTLCFEQKLDNSAFIKVNLLTGGICNEKGPIIIPKELPFLKENAYRTLFGWKKYPTTMSGGIYYFETPQHGLIRVFNNNSFSYKFQSQSMEGHWLEYCDSIKNLPEVLMMEHHSHWISLDKGVKNLLEIRDRNGLVAIMKSEGHIIVVDSKTGEEKKLRSPNSYENLQRIVSPFEASEYLLLTEKKSGNLQLLFPRISSFNGAPLSFEQSLSDPSAFIWSENHHLRLVSSQEKLLGEFNTILTLADKEGVIKKILIPFNEIRWNNKFPSKKIEIVRDSGSYVEIDVNKGQLFSQNSEGWFILAYIALCQKNYAQSLKYLKKISTTDQLSKNSLKVIQWITESHLNVKDRSANGAALRLQAMSLFLKAKRRPDLTFDKKDLVEGKYHETKLKDVIVEDYLTYIDGLNNINASLLLSNSQEQKLIEYYSLNHPSINSRLNFLQSGHYLEEKITPPSLLINKPIKYENSIPFHYCDQIEEHNQEFHFSIIQPGEGFEESFLKLYTMARSGSESDKKYVQFLLDNIQRNKESSISMLAYYLQYALLAGEESPPLEEDMKGKLKKWLEKLEPICFEYNKTNKIRSQKEMSRTSPLSIQNKFSTEKKLTFPLIHSEKTTISEEFEKELKWDLTVENPIIKKVEELKRLSLKLGQDYFVGKKKKESEKKQFEISKESYDERYESAVETSVKEFQEGYEKGREENNSQIIYKIAENKKFEDIAKPLEIESEGVGKSLIELERRLLALANKESPHKEIALRERQLVDGGVKSLLRLPDLIGFFLRKAPDEFKKANPHLTAKEIENIYSKIGHFLLLKTEQQQLQRSLDIIESIAKSSDDLVKESLIQKLAETLLELREYTPNEQAECLVLEYQSNIRIRKKQFELIQQMIKTNDEGVYQNLVTQFPMGGGKTSVVAAILGILAARNKRLSLFIVPAALYKSVKENLQKTQFQNFGQEVAPIDLERKKFTAANLKWIEREIEKAIQKQKLVLMKPEMIQALCLEFIFLLDQLVDADSEKTEKELKGKIETLRSILNVFRSQSDALGDEIDQLLNTLKAVNFPGGEEKRVKQTRIDLIKAIYTVATDKKIEIDFKGEKRSLSSILGLSKNKQTLLSESDYSESIMPVIADSLLSYDPIKKALEKRPELKKSCLRYLCNKIEAKWQEFYDNGKYDDYLKTGKYKDELDSQAKEDLEFLDFLRKSYLSNEVDDGETVNLIALSRHVLNETLPGTLSKNGNRHYGRNSKTHSKVVPYSGVDSPATTQFSDHYRAICFHYQTALLEGITANQIQELAEKTMTLALQSAQKSKKPFNETSEAINFQKATGVDLHLIKRKDYLDKAVAYVNFKPKRILSLERLIIANEVTFHSKRLNSSPHMFFDQFGGGSSFRGFTGTTWNDSTYPPELKVQKDEGSDGKISDLLIERKIPVHQVDSDDPLLILEEILKNHSNPERIRGFIDNGRFKGYDNLKVATKILEFYQKSYEKNSPVEAVVFFGRSEGQSTPDTLFILKQGSSEPIPIQSTHLEAILAKGISLDKIFFYYDERHTFGTDFVQLGNAINEMTVSENSCERDFDQGAMRLRLLFYKQNIEVILNKESAASFINGGKTIDDVILTTVRTQAIAKANQTDYSFFDQMNNVPKRQAFKQLLDMNNSIDEITVLYKEKEYRKLFFAEFQDEPYILHGALSKKINTIDGIKDRAKKLQEQWKEDKNIVSEIDEVVKRAELSPFLTKTIMSPISESMGQGEELEICEELQTEVETDLQKEIQLEVELQQEVDHYNQKDRSEIREEEDWNPKSILSLLEGKWPDKFIKHPLSYLLSNEFVDYKADYGKIFESDEIYITENCRLTYNDPVSVFDEAQKPANQIVFIKTEDKMKVILLSYYEAYQFREFLIKLYRGNWKNKEEERLEGVDRIWLTGFEGDLFINNPLAEFNKEESEIKQLLLQINLFNGNAKYLDENEEMATQWLKKNYELKIRYLTLKVQTDKSQREVLYNSQFLNKK